MHPDTAINAWTENSKVLKYWKVSNKSCGNGNEIQNKS
jgi:hypothetical protein